MSSDNGFGHLVSYSRDELLNMRAGCVFSNLPFLHVDARIDAANALPDSRLPIRNGRYSGVSKTKRSRRTLAQQEARWRKRQTKILQWNVEGLFSATRDSTFQPSDPECDVILLQETFRTQETTIMGFTVHEQLALKPAGGTLGRPSGGILTAVRSTMTSRALEVSENLVHVIISAVDTSIVNCYFQPNTDVDDILEAVSNTLHAYPAGKQVIVAGDFNCRLDVGERGELLQEGLAAIGLELISKPDIPTYICEVSGQIRSSTIDLVFTNILGKLRGSCLKVEQDAVYRRKHRQVHSTWLLPSGNCGKQWHPPSRHVVESVLAQDIEQIQEEVTSKLALGQLDKVVDLVNSSILKATTVKPKPKCYFKRWFDSECYEARRRLRQHLSDSERVRAAKEYRVLCRNKKREYREALLVKELLAAEVNPFRITKTRQAAITAAVPRDVLKEHFTSLLTGGSEMDTAVDVAMPSSIPLFTMEEVRLAIEKSAKRKATGIDNIANEHLIGSFPVLKECWLAIFNHCLKYNQVPAQWRRSLLFLLYKGKGSRDDPNCYRGISLLCSAYKVYTKLVKQRIEAIVEPLLSGNQYGFRKNRSTLDAVGKVIDLVKDAMRKPRAKMYGLFVDFAKAFDTVDRSILLDKLRSRFHLDESYVQLVSNLMRNNTIMFRHEQCQCKSFHGSCTEISQNIGVMQGDSLSPLLFVLYINDIVDTIQNACPGSTVLLYADDMVILTEGDAELKKALLVLRKWCLQNRLKVNTSKTQVIKFRKGGRTSRKDVFMYGGETLGIVKEYNYLGVTLQTGMAFTKQVKRVKAKAVAKIGSISTRISKLSLEKAMTVFNVQIKPIVTYGMYLFASHLGVTSLKHLDTVKSRFLKKVLRLNPTASTELIHKLCGESRLCEDLLEKNYPFGDAALNSYLSDLQETQTQTQECNPLAFVETQWKGVDQPRHFVVGYSVHGFHHRMCSNDRYHQRSDDCICRFCHKSAGHINHIDNCDQLDGSLYQKYCLVKAPAICDTNLAH